jgi:hypothetical protein
LDPDHRPALTILRSELPRFHRIGQVTVTKSNENCAGILAIAERDRCFGGSTIKFPDSGKIAVGRFRNSRHIRRSQERYGENDRSYTAIRILQGNENFVALHLAGRVACNRSDRFDVHAFKETGWSLETRAGVVIASDHDHLKSWDRSVSASQKIEEPALCAGRWVNGIKDIARDDQRIRAPLFNNAHKPIEKNPMFQVAVKTMKRLPKMPVGRM